MDPHRLGEERSVAYHRVIAERLQSQPEILENLLRDPGALLPSRLTHRFRTATATPTSTSIAPMMMRSVNGSSKNSVPTVTAITGIA